MKDVHTGNGQDMSIVDINNVRGCYSVALAQDCGAGVVLAVVMLLGQCELCCKSLRLLGQRNVPGPTPADTSNAVYAGGGGEMGK